MSVNTTDPMIGRLIDGRYQVRSRIARGGMATVYLATDLRLERRVAVKVMHGHLSDDSQFKQRFIQEARSAARLAHPNVVNVFDQGQDSDSAYLVMEYLPGITLRDLLEEYGSLTAQQTIDISEAVLSGLAAAHKAGIVHRDLKPENVLLADDGRIKIGDFGLARAVTANTATGAALLGTIAYLSPELVTRGIADTRSDIYAVGIMMYEMLTGEQPFTGEQPMQIAYRHANEPVPPPSDKKPSVPPELDELVLWATQKNPDDRPADARAMLEQVRDAESAIGTPDAPTAAQKTVVLPAAPPATKVLPPQQPARPHADDETQVLGTRRSAAAAVAAPGSAVAVATPPHGTAAAPTPRRRRRRWIPITAILAVVLVALGVGWYFVLGPGSRITVPDDLTALSVEEATQRLQDAGFQVAQETGTAPHPTAPVGSVAQTDPAMGESVEQGTVVTLLLSSGPQLFGIDLNRGMTQAEAEGIAQEHWTLQDPIRQFDAEVPAGQLIDALDADGASLLEATEYGDQQPITLVLSVGAIPDVRGLTVDEATQALEGKELQAVAGEQVFDNEIESGRVIGIAPTPEGEPVRPGQTLTLIVSKGPDLVQIPEDIEDLTLADAEAALVALGFVVDVQTNIPRVFWDLPAAEVDDVSPDAGEQAIRGSTVVLEAEA